MQKYKKVSKVSYSIGVYPTLELLRFHSEKVQQIFISSRGSQNKGVAQIVQAARENNISVETNDGFIQNISGQDNQYAAAVFEKYYQPIKANADHLVLVNPQDFGNLGTIIRTMLGFNISDLVLVRPAADLFDPKTIRASMGALFQINFEYFDSFKQYQEKFKNNLYCFLTSGQNPLEETKFTPPFSLVFGSESTGLPEDFSRIGTSVRIPHSEKIDSLALPIAVGIALQSVYAMGKN